MRSPKEIAAEVAKLLVEAKRVGRKREKIIKGIVKQMRANDITLVELRGVVGGKGNKEKTEAGKNRKKVAVKYKDQDGNTWTGRGRAPRWLIAEEKAGKNREAFAV